MRPCCSWSSPCPLWGDRAPDRSVSVPRRGCPPRSCRGLGFRAGGAGHTEAPGLAAVPVGRNQRAGRPRGPALGFCRGDSTVVVSRPPLSARQQASQVSVTDSRLKNCLIPRLMFHIFHSAAWQTFLVPCGSFRSRETKARNRGDSLQVRTSWQRLLWGGSEARFTACETY